MKSRITEKGQVTVPKALRLRLGLRPGDELEFEEVDGSLVAQRVADPRPLRRLVGLIRDKVDVDAYLAESRGPAWDSALDGPEEG
jgi:AbrB family looped-hinge helix DNA binding protein